MNSNSPISRLVTLCFLMLVALQTSNAQKGDSPTSIHLRQQVVLLENNLEAHIANPAISATEIIENRYYRLMQFETLPNAASKKQMQAAGIHFLEYIPNNAYLVSFPTNFPLQQLRNWPIRTIVKSPDLIKIHPDLQDQAKLVDEEVELMARMYQDVDPEKMAVQLEGLGAQVLKKIPALHLVRFKIARQKITQLAQQAFIAYLEPASVTGEPEGLGGRNLIRSNQLSHASRNYTGAGVKAMVFDDGFVGPHADFQGRLDQRTLTQGLTNGINHADMVSGIFAGAGNIDPNGIGIAPGAFLHVNNYSNSEATLSAIEWNEYADIQLFNASFLDGRCNLGYSSVTRGIDQMLFERQGMLNVYSCGNAGTSSCGYGAGAGWGTITGGNKQAKNCIAVANLGADGRRQASSSRGPASDGRLKPDLAANGEGQLSITPNHGYEPGGGTSAASPSVAGLCAQLFDAYQQINNTPAPAPLIKAVLLNTAIDLGQPGPDFSHGWGQAHGGRAASVLEQKLYLSANIDQQEEKEHIISIPSNVAEARVMLYWADPPAMESSSKALINNLDLHVISPDNSMSLPLILDHRPDSLLLKAAAVEGIDSMNNMEQVRLSNPLAGDYKVNIQGTNIPDGPQAYYLVYYFLEDKVELTYPLKDDAMVPGIEEYIHWDAFGQTGSFQLDYSINNSNWISIATSLDPSSRNYAWTPPADVTGKVQIRVRRGNLSTVSEPFNLIGQVQNLSIQRVCKDDNELLLFWDPVDGASRYEIRLLKDKYMEAVDTVVGNFSNRALNLEEEQWIAVRALGAGDLSGRQSIAVNYYPNLTNQGCWLGCGELHDVGIRRVISPQIATSGCLDNTIQMIIELENKSENPVSDIRVLYRLNSGDLMEEMVAGPIPPRGTLLFTFNDQPAITEGSHRLFFSVSHPLDASSCNNNQGLNFNWEQGPQSIPFKMDFERQTLCADRASCGRNSCLLQDGGWRNLANAVFDYTDWLVTRGIPLRGNQQPALDHSLDRAEGQYLSLSSNPSGSCISRDAILQSACIDLSTAQNPFFEAWIYGAGAKDASLLVEASVNSQDWIPLIAPITSFSENDWSKLSIDLNVYKGMSVYLRITGVSSGAAPYNLALDDLQVYDKASRPEAVFTLSQLLSCSGRSIQLNDLSLGEINLRNWQIIPNTYTFLQGTNAASAAPIVQFDNNGTYTIRLSVQNATGTSSAERLNEVVIDNGHPLPLIQDFDEWESCIKDQVCGISCLLSDGWRNATNGKEDEADWRVFSGSPRYGTYGPSVDHTKGDVSGQYLFVEPVNCQEQEAILYSGCIDLRGSISPLLSFWHLIPPNRGSALHLDIQVDGQWQQDILAVMTGTELDWTRMTADLTAYKDHTIVLRFRAIAGNTILSKIAMDDIDIYDTADRPISRMTIENPLSCPAFPVELATNSTENATAYQWSFEPATYTFTNGTNAGDEQVSVLFTEAGTYTAILISTNNQGSDTIRLEEAIEIGQAELLPYSDDFSDRASCSRSNVCQLTCPPGKGWTNALNEVDDDIDWQIERARVNTNNSVPQIDYTFRQAGQYFAFLNTNNQCINRKADLISPCIDLAGTPDPLLSYAYYTGGRDSSRLEVSIYSNGQWTTPISTHHNLNQSWQEVSVDLKPYLGQNIRIRFRGETGFNTASYIALDDVEVYAASSPPKAAFDLSQTELCIGSPLRLQNFSKRIATNWAWEISPATFQFTNGTNANSQFPELYFLNDGSYTIQLIASNSAGKDTTVQTVNILNSLPLPYRNDFEETNLCQDIPTCNRQCNLNSSLRNSRSDSNDWFPYNGRSVEVATGPTADHSLGTPWGRYLYIPSGTNCNNKVAELQLPCIELEEDREAKLTFWYHMQGEAMGELHLDGAVNGEWKADLLPAIIGDQGDQWQLAELDLSEFKGAHIALVFRGITGDGKTSNIAIDDIHLFQGDLIVNTQELSESVALRIYPIPTSGRLHLQWSQPLQHVVHWQLFDQQAKLLRQASIAPVNSQQAGIDLQGIPMGLYFLEMVGKEGVWRKRVLIGANQ